MGTCLVMSATPSAGGSAGRIVRLRTAFLWTLVGAFLAALGLAAVGCQVGMPLLTSSGAHVAATGTPSAADSQGHLGPASPGAPYLAAIRPADAGVGAEVSLSGQNLAQSGLTVRFGDQIASYSVQSATSLIATVPPGAQTGEVGVSTGPATPAISSRPFRVIASIGIELPRALTIGSTVSIGLYVTDTSGSQIASPDVALSVVPSSAARVSGYGQVTPLQAGTFTIQAVSGSVVQSFTVQSVPTAQSLGCEPGFSLTTLAGDGVPSIYLNDYPLLSEGATDATPFSEPDGPLQAHLNNPGGMVPYSVGSEDGVLFSDSDIGLLRFVSYDGKLIQTMLGACIKADTTNGGAGCEEPTPQGVPAGDALLVDPTGLALGNDPVNNCPMVVIAETGRDRILGWDPSLGQVRVLAGTGLPVTSDNASNTVGMSSLGDFDPVTNSGGDPLAAGFTDPHGVAVVPAPQGGGYDLIYVADTGDYRIRRILLGANNSEITTLIGTGVAGTDTSAQDGASDSVDTPMGVAALPQLGGQPPVVFVADTDNDRVLQITGDDVNAPGANLTVQELQLLDSQEEIDHPSDIAATESAGGSNPLLAIANGADNVSSGIILWQTNINVGMSASCPGGSDPVDGIAWPRSVMFEAASPGPAFTGDQVLFTDEFSDRIRRASF